MKKIAIVTCILLLAGCSEKYPLTTNLHLRTGSQPTGIYNNSTIAVLKGHDARRERTVVAYRIKDQPEILLENATEPHVLITDRLANGFLEQGLVFENGAPVRIQINLDELLVNVSRPKLLYSATARSHVTLTINNRGTTLTKTYDREANRESATRPPVQDLEAMLNEQLNEIVKQILQDDEVRSAIRTI